MSVADLSPTSTKTRLVIDADVGLDDAQAIMLALANDDVIIEGITTVCGNTSVDNVCRNVRKLLALCQRTDIPVYRGSAEPLLKRHHKQNDHGSDGFGDVKDDVKSDDVIEYGHAANYLTEIVSRYPKQIVLVCLGPLTNVALAMKLDPKFGETLKECHIMGGNYRGQGNVTPCAEFNFHYDPEAALIVLENIRCPTTMLCWEVCLDHVMGWDTWERLFTGTGPVRSFLRRHEARAVEVKQKRGLPYMLSDQLCMGVALDRRMAGELFQAGAEVEVHGAATRGLMIVRRHMAEGEHPVSIVMKMKMDKFLEMFTQTLDKLDQRVLEVLTANCATTNNMQQRKYSKTISQYLPSPNRSSSS